MALSFDEWYAKKKKEEEEAQTFDEWYSQKYGKSPTASTQTSVQTTNDIAPVRTQEEKERTWFTKGAFEDGYQKGDFLKTVAGTGRDLMQDIYAGMVGFIEPTIDTGAYIAGGIAGFFGADEFQDNTAKFIAKDIINENKVGEVLGGINGGYLSDLVWGKDYEANSVLGDKSDSLVQSGGQLATTVVLQSAGVPWWLTTGVTSFGSGTEEAFQNGASYGEAGLSGAINAGADILTEKLFSSSILGEKGLIKLDGLTKGITSKAFKALADWGIDIASEGTEEVAASFITRLGNSLTYEREDTWQELLTNEKAMDNYIAQVGESLFGKEARAEYGEAFIGGAVLGGGMNSVKLGNSIKSGADYRTGFTTADEKVLDKVYNDAVAEAEKDGKKLTSKEKKDLYNSFVEQMEKGQLDTDTIESVLGGDDYKAYKEIADSTDMLQKRADELGSKQQPTLAEQYEYSSLVKRLDESNAKKSDVRATLDQTMSPFLKNSRLAETYAEKARRGQAFEADLSQYTGKQRDAVERAINSGVLNNTRRSHELVDILSKIEADKGITFDYTNNKKLKETGFALDGKTVNGFVKGGSVTLNVQSSKAWQSTVGHEVTHILEGTDAYSGLQQVLFEYAKSKGELDSRRATLTELYKNVKDADIDAELTADLVGEYLFTDKEFINKLTGNRTLFQKIYDEIKYLYKVATGKEKADIEKVKAEFDKAWKELSTKGIDKVVEEATDAEVNEILAKNGVDPVHRQGGDVGLDKFGFDESGAVKYSLTKDIENFDNSWYNEISVSTAEQQRVQSEALTWNAENRNQIISQALSNGITYQYVIDNDGIVHIYGKKKSANIHEFGGSYDNRNTERPDRYVEKFRHQQGNDIGNNVLDGNGQDQIAPIASNGAVVHGEGRSDGTGYSKTGANAYRKPKAVEWQFNEDGSVDVTYSDGTQEKENIAPIKEASSTGGVFSDGKNLKYSVSEDSNGNELSLAVQKRFANSKAVDENGNLKVLYHGTASGEFYTFDKSKGSVEGDFGSGFYFTDNESDVESNYEGGGADFENKIARRAEQIEAEEGIDYSEAEARARKELYVGSNKHTVYLNIENPAIVGETNLLDYDSFAEEYDREDYDSDEDYESDVEYLIQDKIDEIIWGIQRNVDVDNTDGIAEVLWSAVNEGGIDIEQLKANINNLYLEDSNGNLVGNEVTRQIIESLGYDGIIDNTVSTKFNMNLEEGTTHYIVFKPNQIKSVDNQNPTDNPDIRYSLSDIAPTNRKSIVSKLTGREISEQTYATMDKLGRGESVALEELDSLPEVIEGKEKVKEFRNKFLSDHPEFKDVPAGDLGTYLINSAEREQLRNSILQGRLKSGSFTGLDSEGKEVYNGGVEKGKRLDIVIGLPAAGKSTSIVNPLSQYYKSVVVDSDIIKGELPEFNEGWGASLVHEESSKLNSRMLAEELKLGNNIVLPVVGSKVSSIEKYLNLAKEKGYEVHLHLNELNSSKAMGRMLGRYFSQGRFIPPEVSYKYGDKPTTVYEEMKNRGDISGYSHWNNDVQKGQRPTLTGVSGNNQLYAEYSNSWRTSRGTDIAGRVGEGETGKYADSGNGVGGLQMGMVEEAPTRENSKRGIGLPEVVRLSLSPISLSPKTQEALSKSGVVSLELIDSSDDSNAFSIALSEARASDVNNGWAVTPKSAEDLIKDNIRTIMTTDSKAGLGVDPNGDIVAVFKNQNGGQPRVLNTLIPAALEMGGNKLDCYGEGLVDLYARYGFVPVARVTFNPVYANDGWTPDIFFMVHNGDSADTVAANIGKYKKWTTDELNELPLYDKEAYEDACAYRDSLLDIAPTFSLSKEGEDIAPVGNYFTPLNETALEQETVAPTRETVAKYDRVKAPFPDKIAPMTEEEANALQDEKARADAKAEGNPKTRKQLHHNIIDGIKSAFSGQGFNFDTVLKKAKNLSTFSTVDNTPQRVMEKALGYKEGQILADLTVNKVAQNETEGIKWLNSYLDKKVGQVVQISKQYNIKPGSKESAAAQMYAEGFYVNENNDIIAYGDAELAQDFPNANVRSNIKALAKDQRIRQIYDETLKAINESRARNAYPEIQRLDNYFLHFRAMGDTFSKLGLPFNPNDIRAKDLPTDLNGVTADLKPGQPYFASAQHRTGKRTSFDLLGGLEMYLTSAKNQIYHIDDIQTLRALRNYIADTYGQANGLEDIDTLSDAEAQEKIEQVYGSHLSTFAKFLNEEANILAGKTALMDRGLEGIIGRRGMTFLDTIRKQTGANMVGFNISSSLTNFIPVAQTIAKTNKFDFLKAFTQTVSNRLGSITGNGDNFAENSPVMIRRKGADRFAQTPFQKVADAGYGLMSAVDGISTELIARTKFNELTRKGMDEQQAHFETDKWVSRLMGDRSLGQMPQLYNSKTLGFITQFQLEVRNQLDSQFYDTIQEAKASNEDIKDGLERNAKTAAKVASTFVQLAVAQHLFGKAFESVAGYNPAFDIISVLATMLGFDDDEESEDTALDNIEQGFLELMEDLPYTSLITDGGRIPISSALPLKELVSGTDKYGNEKSRLETLTETAPYYFLPGGYGQIKKTMQGLNMFSDEHPVSGSYTDSGNLRFPVEDTPLNRLQAGLFGQYASENAREYFNNDYAPLKEKQIQEYIDVDMPIKDYWKYRKGLAKQETLEDKFNYIAGLDLPVEKKNILINNVVDRKDPVDLENYDDFSSLEEFDYATKNPDKYALAKSVGGYSAYTTYSKELYNIKADKDEFGKSISGSRKEKVVNYINNLDADYETKIILYKSEYPSDDTYNMDIINYLNNREDLTYEERVAIYTELGFTVSNGYVYW